MDERVKKITSLDPVTFEVLRNAFITIVDQMAEQVRRTCYSFVVFNRDFSNGLCDARGDTVAQGNQDLAAHVGTLHYTCKAVIKDFDGDIHPGDGELTASTEIPALVRDRQPWPAAHEAGAPPGRVSGRAPKASMNPGAKTGAR